MTGTPIGAGGKVVVVVVVDDVPTFDPDVEKKGITTETFVLVVRIPSGTVVRSAIKMGDVFPSV